MSIDVSATVAGIENLIAAIDLATQAAVSDAASQIQQQTRAAAPKRSGDLADSIVVDTLTNSGTRYALTGVNFGPYAWSQRVGPTVVYGRIRDIGGDIPGRGKRAKSPHGYLKWYWQGKPVFMKRVHQKGTKWFSPPVERMADEFPQLAAKHWAAAIESI